MRTAEYDDLRGVWFCVCKVSRERERGGVCGSSVCAGVSDRNDKGGERRRGEDAFGSVLSQLLQAPYVCCCCCCLTCHALLLASSYTNPHTTHIQHTIITQPTSSTWLSASHSRVYSSSGTLTSGSSTLGFSTVMGRKRCVWDMCEGDVVGGCSQGCVVCREGCVGGTEARKATTRGKTHGKHWRGRGAAVLGGTRKQANGGLLTVAQPRHTSRSGVRSGNCCHRRRIVSPAGVFRSSSSSWQLRQAI